MTQDLENYDNENVRDDTTDALCEGTDVPENADAPEEEEEKQPGKAWLFLDRVFHLKERGTTVKGEILAGITSFFAMALMLFVSCELLETSVGSGSFSRLYFGLSLTTAVCTILLGVLCNLPLAQSTNLGFVTVIVSALGRGSGLTYANVLLMALVASVIFLVVMLVKPAKNFLLAAVPDSVKKALPAAVGLYVIFYALTQTGFIETGSGSFATLFSFSGVAWTSLFPFVAALLTFVLMFVLKKFNIKGAVLFSLVGGFLIYLLLNLTCFDMNKFLYTDFGCYFAPTYNNEMLYYLAAGSSEWGTQSFFSVFTSGFDFSAYTGGGAQLFGLFVTTIASFLMIGISSTGANKAAAEAASGTIFASDKRAERVYLASSISAVVGCVTGSGPVVVSHESAAGTSGGGRTGITAIVAGLCFVVGMFTVGCAALFRAQVVYPVMFFLGLTMMRSIGKIDRDDFFELVPALVTIVMSGLTMNITYGIAFGIIVHTLVKLLGRKFKEIGIGTGVLAVCMVLYLIFCVA